MRRRKSRRFRGLIRRFMALAVLVCLIGAFWYGCVARRQHPQKAPHPAATPAQAARTGSLPPPPPTPVSKPGKSHPPAPTPVALRETPSPHLPPRAAIIIDDFGNNWEMDRRFIESEIPLTVAVLPDCSSTRKVAEAARKYGKPLILHLPMEPLSGCDPGPGRILASMRPEEVRRVLEEDLRGLPVEGLSNHQGSKATAVGAVAEAVAEVARKRNLYIVDSVTSPKTVFSATARELGVKTTSRQVFLDNRDDPEYIRGQLRELIQMAKERGEALAIGHVRKNTLESLEKMLPSFREEGVDLVYARELVR